MLIKELCDSYLQLEADSDNGFIMDKSPSEYHDRTIGYNRKHPRIATVQKILT